MFILPNSLCTFQKHAHLYYELGLAVIPCGGDNGKIALVKWKSLNQATRQQEVQVEDWRKTFPDANIAAITGAVSGIMVIDSDDPAITLPQLFAQFGITPLVVETPRGGKHLYYRFNGELCCTRLDERKIDVRGQNGYVLLPPSVSLLNGKQYRFIYGDWSNLQNLPYTTYQFAKKTPPICNSDSTKNGKGKRNNKLFYYLKDNAAPQAESTQHLTEMALTYNSEQNTPPLSQSEVERTVQQVWEYKITGRLFSKKEQYITLSREEHELLVMQPHAYALYAWLRFHYSGYKKPFPFSANQYRKELGGGKSVFRKAMTHIVSNPKLPLSIYKKGGKQPGKAHLYCFVSKKNLNRDG